jgi:hypothetical protein
MSEREPQPIRLSRNTWLGLLLISFLPMCTVTVNGMALHQKLEAAVAEVQADIKAAEERIQAQQNELEIEIEKNRANSAKMFMELLNRIDGQKQ